MLQRFLLLWLVLLSLLAWAWPQSGLAEWDPFRASKPILLPLFSITMFAVGSLLPRDEIREVFRKWPTVFGGTALQYTAMPALAFVFAKLMDFDENLTLGVILVGCVPGAMASNVLTMAARGNVSYSVSLTTAATLFSPLVVPLVLYVTAHQSGLDRWALATEAFFILTTQVVGPVILGHALARRFAGFQRVMEAVGPVIANLTILWIIAVVVNANHNNLAQAGTSLLLTLLGINLLGFTAGWFGGRLLRLPAGMRRALTLEVGMQNAGLGTILAGQLFAGRDLIALPPALYTFGCMLTGTLLAQYWSTRGTLETPEPIPVEV